MIIFEEALSYDDVLLTPKYSEVTSRSSVDTFIKIKDFKFEHPIIPANMKSISGKDMAKLICKSGGLAILHRFMPIEEQLSIVEEMYKKYPDSNKHVAVSVGVKNEDKENISKFLDVGVKIFCIDIAHGDSKACVDMVQHIKSFKNVPDLLLIAGNVATGEAATRLWKAGADVVKVGVGPGCWAAGTRILMSNGTYKNIEDVQIGDFVINKDGNSVKVIDAFSTGIRKVSKVRNNSFYKEGYVTSDHRFWIGDLSSASKETLASRGYSYLLDKKSKTTPKKSKYMWKEIGNAENSVFLFPKNIKFNMPNEFSIDLVKRFGGNKKENFKYKEICKISQSYDTGYMFGTFLGDGTASLLQNGSGSVSWVFGKNEKDIVEKLSKILENIFDKSPKIIESHNVIKVIMYHKPFAKFLSTFGKKDKKHLPENLFISDKEYLKGIYDGLLDSDGMNENGRLSLSNTSPQLIELFNVINFILFGYLPNNMRKDKSVGTLKNCNINNCKDAYIARTLKNPKVRLTKDYFIIKNMEYTETNEEVKVYDLTVDCDTHSFIANNMIVHNSLCTTRVETGNGVPQLSALMDVFQSRKYYYNQDPDSYNKKYIIADGGIKSAGDCVKALCFSDMVMVGNMFSGTDETPGEVLRVNGVACKEYVGSSTHKTSHIEGVAALVPTKGSAKDILDKLLQGIKSGCSYQGCYSVDRLQQISPTFVKITSAGLKESHPHNPFAIGNK